MRRAPPLSLLPVCVVLLAPACTPDLPRTTIHLRRPVDMAVACVDHTTSPRTVGPVESCFTGEGDASARKAGTQLVGLVANAERGSIAKLDLESGAFADLDAFVPGFSPVPIGLRPVSAVSAADGKAVYTANAASPSIGRLWLPYIENGGAGGTDVPPDGIEEVVVEQPLPSAPTDVLVTPEGELLVALPDLAAVARVPVDRVGTLSTLDQIPIPGGSPYDLALSDDGTRLFVGHADAAQVSIVDLPTGAEQHIDIGPAARPSEYVPVAIPLPDGAALPACANGVDDDGDGGIDFGGDPDCTSPTAAMETPPSIPVLAQVAPIPGGEWLYALDTRARSIAVIDIEKGERVDVNAPGRPGANDLFRELGRTDIHLSGVPTTIAGASWQATLSGAGDAEHTLAQGLAYVGSATGEVYVLEVDGVVREKTGDGDFVETLVPGAHWLRDGNDADDSYPSAPQLYDRGKAVPLGNDRRPEYPSFGEYVQRDDEGSYFGIRMKGDVRLELGETWSVVHQGAFLVRESRLAALDTVTGELVTPEPVFCSAGVEVGDVLVVRFPEGLSCGAVVGKRPDGTDRRELEGRAFAYTVAGVSEQRLVLAKGSGTLFEGPKGAADDADSSGAGPTPVPDMNAVCFGGPLRYELRVPKGVYTVIGSQSGYLHPWKASKGGSCERRPDADDRFVGRTHEWVLAAASGTLPECPVPDDLAETYFEDGDTDDDGDGEKLQPFSNHAFELRVFPGCERDDVTQEVRLVETRPDVGWAFSVNAAVRPRTIGPRAGAGEREVNMGNPQSLRWVPAHDALYIIDSGQEQVIEVEPGPDRVRKRFL